MRGRALLFALFSSFCRPLLECPSYIRVWRAVLCLQGQFYCWQIGKTVNTCNIRASDISRGCGPAKFRYFREIPRNSPKNEKYCEIRQKYFQIHVGKTYLILILAIRPVLFTPNVQIYLETSSLQRVNNVPKLPGVFR